MLCLPRCSARSQQKIYYSTNVPQIKVVGRNSCLFKAFLPVHVSREMLHEQPEEFFCNSSFTGEVSTTVNLER